MGKWINLTDKNPPKSGNYIVRYDAYDNDKETRYFDGIDWFLNETGTQTYFGKDDVSSESWYDIWANDGNAVNPPVDLNSVVELLVSSLHFIPHKIEHELVADIYAMISDIRKIVSAKE